MIIPSLEGLICATVLVSFISGLPVGNFVEKETKNPPKLWQM